MKVKSCWWNKRSVGTLSISLLGLGIYILAAFCSTENKSFHSGEMLSTCDWQTDSRGFHQNVVAFSLYGSALSHPDLVGRYLKPLEETAHRLPKLYPGTVNYI